MTQHQLKYLPVDELKVSALNMRRGRKAPNVDDIYPSILKSGVHETLLVRKEGKTYGVVAGRRRLFALRRKAKETGKPQRAPCAIMQPGDDAAAMEASIIENTGHQPVTEMQALDAYGRLAKKGRTIAEIADYFGVTELKVKRILALAGLHDDIRALYAAEKIDVPSIRALTLASDEQQVEWLRLFNSEDEYAPRGERLKAWLAGGERISDDKALFDLKDYDGTLITDLFGDNAIFADADHFWTRQNEAIAALADGYRTSGWRDVVILERGKHFPAWNYAKRPKSKDGKVFIEIRHDGLVTAHEGYLSHDDVKKINRILSGDAPDTEKDASIKPEMSGPMVEYIDLHRHVAVRAELCNHPKIALRLALAHLIAGSPLWRVGVEDQRTRKEATAESLAASEGEKRFAERRAEAVKLLESEDGDSTLVDSGLGLPDLFAKLLTLDDAEVLQIFAVAMGETLTAGSPAVEAAAHAIQADIAGLWSPDDAFFDLLRDKRAINAMLGEAASPRTARSMVSDTGKAQKQALRNRMVGIGCDARPDWRPRWMAVPPGIYVKGAASPPGDRWNAIAPVFENAPTEKAPDTEDDTESVAA